MLVILAIVQLNCVNIDQLQVKLLKLIENKIGVHINTTRIMSL